MQRNKYIFLTIAYSCMTYWMYLIQQTSKRYNDALLLSGAVRGEGVVGVTTSKLINSKNNCYPKFSMIPKILGWDWAWLLSEHDQLNSCGDVWGNLGNILRKEILLPLFEVLKFITRGLQFIGIFNNFYADLDWVLVSGDICVFRIRRIQSEESCTCLTTI